MARSRWCCSIAGPALGVTSAKIELTAAPKSPSCRSKRHDVPPSSCSATGAGVMQALTAGIDDVIEAELVEMPDDDR